MRNRPDRGRGRLQLVILSGLLAAALAACGGSAAATKAPSGADPTAAPLDTEQPTATAPSAPEDVTIDVAKEAWFAGFHVTFGSATLEHKNGRGTVRIEAMFENTGDDSARLDATISLESAGETANEAFDMDIPGVAGFGKSKGLFAFSVKDTFSFDDAVLTLGLPTNQQAIIPLKGGADAAVSLEPSQLTLSGSATAGDLKLDVTSGELRADSPWKHGQQKKGTLILTIGYNATFDSDFAGGFAFTGENVRLKLPDGSLAAAIGDGQSQSIELISAHTTKKDLLTRFEIEDPAEGTYTFVVVDGDATGEASFTID